MKRSSKLLIGVACCSLTSCWADNSHLRKDVDVEPWLRSGRRIEATPANTVDNPTPTAAPQMGELKAKPQTDPIALPIDLAAALQLAGSSAIEVKIARSEAEEAAFVAEAQQAQFLPFLSPRLGYFRQEGQAQNTVGQFLDVDRQNATAGTGVDLVLQPSEAIYRSLAAERRADAATANYKANVNLTLLRAARSYFVLAASHARSDIARDDVRAATELLRIEKSREDAGAGLPATVARAQARLAQAEGNLQSALGAVASDNADLVGLLNFSPGTALRPKIADALVAIKLTDPSQTLEQLIQRAHQQNPQIDAARQLIAAASAEQDMTRWGWMLPELRAGATFDGFGQTFGSLDERDNYYIGVQWRLDFGLPARHAANVQRHEQAELRLANVRNLLAASIARLRSEIQAASARIEAAQREAEAAAESFALVQSRYAEGVDLLLQVMDAQTALSRARTNLITAVGDHNTAQYALLRAIGGPR